MKVVLAQIYAKYANEPVETMYKRLKQKLKKENVFNELKAKNFYVKPSEKKRQKKNRAIRKINKAKKISNRRQNK